MRYRLFFILIVCFFLLALRFYFYYQDQEDYKDGEKVIITASLLKQPQVNGLTQQFTLKAPKREAVVVKASRFPSFSYGQSLIISGTVKKKLLGGKKTIATIYFPKIEAKQETFLLPLSFVSGLRNKLIAIFSFFLPIASSGLLLGIVFGIRETMPDFLQSALRNTGVMHITAASGMNVTLVAAFMMSFFGLVFPRRAALVVSILAIWFYALLSGLEASIVRASLMASSLFLALLIGRQYTGFLSLAVSGYIMLFLSPSLLFDIGFQLSFASTLSIIILSYFPKSENHVVVGEKNVGFLQKILDFFAQDMRITLASQVATLPLLLAYFGQYSLLSLPANLLILWTVPPLMVLGGIAAFLGLIFLPLASLVLYVSLPLLLYIQFVILFLAKHSLALQVGSLSDSMIIGYYAVVLGLVVFYCKRK